MSMTPYNDHRASLPWPYGKGYLDIVQASQTHRKANITKATGHKLPSLQKRTDFFTLKKSARLRRVLALFKYYLFSSLNPLLHNNAF